MHKRDKRELLASIEADRESHIAFLQAFIQAPSPNPPGDTTQAAEVIRNYLHDRGASTRILGPKAHLPNVVSDFNGLSGSGPRVVMNGHMDVFPVGADDGDNWTHGPWSGFNDGKHIYGRGAVDMKAGTAASCIAYTYLHERRKHLKGSLALTAVSDEETGGKWGSRWLLDQDGEKSPWRGDCMINAEPSGLQSIRFGEKGTLRLTFTIRTPGAHGAYLHLSEGANRVAARLITALTSVEDIIPPHIPDSIKEHVEKPEVRAVMDEIMGKGAADIALKPTLNIGTLHGGLKVNMIPDLCIMEADIRLPIGLTADLVLTHIRSLLRGFPEVELQVQEAASNPASYCAIDHPLLTSIADNAENVTGRKPLGIPSLGATDCKFWRYVGVPAYSFGVSPETMAARDERVVIEEFLAVVRTHALAIWDYLGGPA
jgi:succinyl-diaminopimelate desuccinylase